MKTIVFQIYGIFQFIRKVWQNFFFVFLNVTIITMIIVTFSG